MGLTKPRAAQIFNLDYKQSTRVVTATNITLSGGAPSLVDGVTLSLGDRVLVTGQTTGSQNGLYYVTTLGSGANGTWARTSDGNENGEIEAGMIVMVTEGVIYADTQWKLITDDPITINTTALTFTQNYMANSISSGSSNVVVNSNANVTVSSAGTANVLTVSSTGTFVSGVVSATGNITGNYMLGNGAFLTGVITSVANINDGSSNVTVVSSGGNVTVGVGGTGNVAVFSTSGLDVTGRVSATGNVTGSNILGNGSGLTGINSFSNVTVTGGNSAVADGIADTLTLTAGTGISIVVDPATDTITIGTQSGSEIFVDGADFGTVTEPVTLSDDLGLVTDLVDSESDLGSIVTSGVFYPDLLVVEDITDFILGGGNNGQYLGTYGNGTIFWQSVTSAPLSGTMVGNINGNTFSITNLTSLEATGNVTGGNLVTVGQVTATGNITGGNVTTTGIITATGNITGNFIFGNGSQLTGIDATGIQSGTSNVRVVSSGGNVTTSIGGTSNVVVVNTTGQFVTGLISATGNVSGGNLVVTGNIVDTAALSILSGANGNISLSPNGTGVVIMTANTIPNANATLDLGSTTARWRTVFTSDLDLNNGIGDWTIVEGEDDLFLYNNKKGKVFKFALIEVDPGSATPKIDGLK